MQQLRRSHTLVLAAIILSVPAVSHAQAPPRPQPRDTRPAVPDIPVGTASIAGAVVVAGTGQPARRARVNISGVELRGGRTATTDDQGRFVFSGLPAGRYSLMATKPGHVQVTYGQRQAGSGRSGTPIQLSDGQRFQAQLQMPKGGVISGTVLDEHAEPTPGTQVRVMRYVMQSGLRRLQPAGNAQTDDRGMYRIYGLQPGEYVVCATPRNLPADDVRIRTEIEATSRAAENVARTDAVQAQQLRQRVEVLRGQMPADEPQAGYAPICYPGTMAVSSAGTLSLGISEERASVDFQLQLISMGTVEGTIAAPAGVNPQTVQITLVNTGVEVPGFGNSSTRPGPDGRFRISNVAPGEYTLIARGTAAADRIVIAASQGGGAPPPPRPEPVRYWGSADVSVDGRTPASVVLSLQPGMTVTGQLTFDGAATQPADLTRMRVTLVQVESSTASPELSTSSGGRVDATGRFTVTNVVPGKYRLSAGGAANGWYLESSSVGGQDALDFPFEVKPNQSITGATITFTDRQTALSGTLLDGKGEPATAYTLVVFPADQRFWIPGSRRTQTARPATDGRFTLRNLPAGDYRIATVIDPEPGSWTDPGYLQQLEGMSMRVTLAAGEKKVQNIRLSAAQ